MAKPKMPTKRELNELERILKIRTKVRRVLLNRRRKAEEQQSSNRLPELVLPEPAKATRQSMRRLLRKAGLERWRKQLRLLKEATGYTDEKSWYRIHYKYPILEAWRNAIAEQFNYRIDDNNKAIPREEIELVRKTDYRLAEFLESYNRIVLMSVEQFMDMYDGGYMPEFKYIYLEMLGESKEYDALEELNEGIKKWRQMRRPQVHEKHNKSNFGKRL